MRTRRAPSPSRPPSGDVPRSSRIQCPHAQRTEPISPSSRPVTTRLTAIAIEALDAGCHVLVEKPGARDRDELGRVADAARRAGRVARVGYNHRFHPAALAARELVVGEGFGPLLSIRARYGHGGRLGYESEWRADPARGGGELLDQASHLVDLVRFIAGDVTLAFAELRTDFWDMAVEDNAFLALRPARGGFAWLHASWTEWKNLFAVEIALRDALARSDRARRLLRHRAPRGPRDEARARTARHDGARV